MKKILITGGAGFVGSHLCRKLLNEGNEIICLDNLFTGGRQNIMDMINNPKFTFVMHDINNPFWGQFDEIYNLACPASPIYYQKNPVETTKTAVLGSINMLELALKTKATILQASTSEVYGDPEIHPQKESYWGNVNPIGIRSCYDEGKRCSETLFMDYYREYKVNIRIVRIFNTYGPSMNPSDGRVVSNFIMQALKNQDITIYGDGNQTRSFQYIDDLIEVMIKMMNNKIGFIGPVNVGTDFDLCNNIKLNSLDNIPLSNTLTNIVGSREVYSFVLEQGKSYTLESLGHDEDSDTSFFLYDNQGNKLSENDDIGGGIYRSKITYTSLSTGYYYLGVMGYQDEGISADYTLSITTGGLIIYIDTDLGLKFNQSIGEIIGVLMPACNNSNPYQSNFYNDYGVNCNSSPLININIPLTINGVNVLSIGSQAFEYQYIETLTLPSTLTNIGDYAFQGNNLTSITIPDGVTYIGESAFNSNDDLISITLPNTLTNIGENAFYNASYGTGELHGWSSGNGGTWILNDTTGAWEKQP